MLVGCGDDDDATPGGVAGSSVGGSSAGKSSTAGSDAGGSDDGGKGGTFGTAGTDAGGKGGTEAGGTAGTGGTPATECTAAIDCFDDFNPCTTAACEDGKCVHNPDDDASCDDNNGCTDDKCDAGKCVSTNNTAACNDNNQCTSQDKCVDGECKGTNNTAVCDDLSSCTTDDKCANGLCTGTRNTTDCPLCATPDNMIKNCDFTSMLDNWATTISFDGGNATQSVVDEHDEISVIAGGTALYSVQPRQEPLSLKQGFRYKFGLVAGSDVPRDAAVALTQAAGMYKVYSAGDSDAGGFKVALTAQMKPFNFEFLMTDPDDANVKLEIKVGGANATANSKTYFDDVYVREIKCATPADCSDGNSCTDDACNATTGQCTWTAHVGTCEDDDESCTDDVCEGTECKHNPKADDAGCDDDGKACSVDSCQAGVCTHVVDDATCMCAAATDCDDNNACTDDTCTAMTCGHVNNTATCNDQDDCTPVDVCGGGTCGGTSVCFVCAAAENVIKNCDFTDMLTGWDPAITFEGGVAAQTVDAKGRLSIAITNPGGQVWSVQPRQAGIALVANKKYTVKFNAMATTAQKMTVGITQNGNPYTNYGKLDAVDVGPVMKLYTFVVDATAAPAADSKLELLLGGPNGIATANTLTFDNFSMVEQEP